MEYVTKRLLIVFLNGYNLININDHQFWEEVWETSRKRSSSKKGVEGYQEYSVDKWNIRAKSFAKQTDGKTEQNRWKEVESFLAVNGVSLEAGAKVLDIGSGPGNFAIPFAKAGAKVWALDPAEKMIKILEEKIAQENLKGIKTITAMWEDIDLQKEGWLKNFDIVFASMSPGINSKETLEKMMAASKKYCYLSSFAGTRQYPLQEEIAKEILGEDYKTYSPDIIYPFNLLYSMGYYPNIQFKENISHRDVLIEDIFDEIISHIGMYTQITKDIEITVKNHLHRQAVNGKVKKYTKSRIGMMIWEV